MLDLTTDVTKANDNPDTSECCHREALGSLLRRWLVTSIRWQGNSRTTNKVFRTARNVRCVSVRFPTFEEWLPEMKHTTLHPSQYVQNKSIKYSVDTTFSFLTQVMRHL